MKKDPATELVFTHDFNEQDPFMEVFIPTCEKHEGKFGSTYKISSKCPVCGGPRGKERWKGPSWDGSRILRVDCWRNECGHVDLYADIRKEGKEIKKSE